MKSMKKFVALGLSVILAAASLAGCGSTGGEAPATAEPDAKTETAKDDGADAADEKTEYADDEIVDFTFFAGMPGTEMLFTPPTTGTVCSMPATLMVTVPAASLGIVTLITAFSPRLMAVVFAEITGVTLDTVKFSTLEAD